MSQPDTGKIVALHKAGVPLKLIAEQTGVPAWKVSSIALGAGALPRNVHAPVDLMVKLRPVEHDALKKLARRQRTSPEVIAREAIAAWLGLDR